MFENEWIMVKLPNICCVFDGKNTVLLGLKKKEKKNTIPLFYNKTSMYIAMRLVLMLHFH